MIDKFLEHIQDKHNSKNNLTLLNYSLQKVQDGTGKLLDDIDYESIQSYLRNLELSDSSIETIQRKLIQYYNWMFDTTDDPKYHKIAKQIKSGKIARPKAKISPVDLVNPEEVKSLINASTIERNRCIVAVLYEGGLRVGELLALTNAMVQIDTTNEEVVLHIPNIEGCKTGARSVPCVEIYPYIVAWLKCNSSNPNDKFIPLSAKQVRNIVAGLYKKAGINKPCHPHMLRHSQITYMASLGSSETELSYRFWGIAHSAMVTVYIHLSEQQKADSYKNRKGLGNGNNVTVVNPLALHCVECGHKIESGMGNLCKACSDAKKLKEENTLLKSKLEALDDKNIELEEDLGILKLMVKEFLEKNKDKNLQKV